MSNKEIQFLLTMRDQATHQFKRFEAEVKSGMAKIRDTVSKFGTLLAGAFGIKKLRDFVAASNQQEDAVKKLNTALRNVGETNRHVQTDMENYASSLQQITTYGDEEIIALQAQLVSMTGLRGRGLEPLTRATLDLAAGFNMDAEAAGLLIAKTIAGQDALGRYGISIKGAKTETEKAAKIVEVITEKFGGMAEAMGQTQAGKIKQFTNAWGDLEEQFGDIIKNVGGALLPYLKAVVDLMTSAPAPIQAMALAVVALAAAFVTLHISISPVSGAIAALLALGVGLLAWLGDTSTQAEQVANRNKDLAASFDLLANRTVNFSGKSVGAIRASREELLKDIKAQEDWADQLKNHPEWIGGSVEAREREIKKTREFIATLKDEVAQHDRQITILSAVDESTRVLNQKLKDMREELASLSVGSRAYAEKLVEIGAAEEELSWKLQEAAVSAALLATGLEGQDIEALAAKMQHGLVQVSKAAKDAKKEVQGVGEIKLPAELIDTSSIAGMREKIRALEDMLEKVGTNTPGFDRLKDELRRLRAQFDTATRGMSDSASDLQRVYDDLAETMAKIGYIGREAFNLINQAQQQNLSAALDAIETRKEADLERIDAQLEMIDQLAKTDADKEAMRTRLVQQRAKIEAQYEEMAREEKLRAWKAQKQASLLMAVINTAEAVTKALAQGGFIFGIPMAAVMASLGAAQVAVIASQEPPKFHEGTGGQSVLDRLKYAPQSEEFPIIVRGGETVRTEAEERDIQSELRAARSGGSRLVAGGGGNSLVFNFYGPVSSGDFVWREITRRLRETGLTIDKVAVDQRANLVLG